MSIAIGKDTTIRFPDQPPVWQRARLLHPRVDGVKLVWVRAVPPQKVRIEGGRMGFGYETNLTDALTGIHYWVGEARVELLGEFADIVEDESFEPMPETVATDGNDA